MAKTSHPLVIGVCLFIAVITAIVFGQTARHEFVNFDDDVYVYENGVVQKGLSADGVKWAFTHVHASNWHPLTTISLMADRQFHGANASGYHLTNVILHGAAAILLFLVLRQMTGALWASAFVAVVFAIHPLRAESVAWVSERKDVLSGLFFVLTLGAYVRYARKPSVKNYLPVVVLYGLGLLCKPMLVTVPVVLLLLDFWPLRRLGVEKNEPKDTRASDKNYGSPPHPALSPDGGEGKTEDAKAKLARSKKDRGLSPHPCPLPQGEGESTSAVVSKAQFRRLVIEKVPLLAMAAAVAVTVFLVQDQARRAAENISFSMRAGNALVSSVIYVKQLFYPVRLAAFYPYPTAGHSVFEIVASLLALGVVTAMVLRWRRQRPYLLMGWVWYLVMLLPVIGLVQVGAQAHADRYTYLPEIGLLLALVWAVKDATASWPNRHLALGIGAACVVVLLVPMARAQAAYWHDSETLWKHTLACTTNNAVAEENLASEYFRQARFGEAIEHASAAVELDAKYADAQNCLGFSLYQAGQMDGALTHLQEAVKLRPGFADAQDNLGVALLRAGKLDEAIGHFQEAVKIAPGLADAQCNLGAALVQKGLPQEAVGHYQQAIEARPDHLGAHNNYAWVLASSTNAAVRNGARAVELAQRANQFANSRNLIVLRTLAAAYAENGQFPLAIEAAGQALQLAEAKNEGTWMRAIRAEIGLYQNGKAFRADGTVP